MLATDPSEFISFFQETKETRWVLAANILTIPSSFILKSCEDLSSHSEYSHLEHEEIWEAMFQNLGYDETTPKFLLSNAGGAYCSILAFLFDSYQLSFSSGPDALC